MRNIDLIVFHCSDSDNIAHDDIAVIKQWHLSRGFDDVGYHYFIQRNGEIQQGRDEWRVGAHCVGYNTNSIGICLHGKNKFNSMQFDAAARLCRKLINKYEINTLDILPHNQLSQVGKTCPNFDIMEIIQRIPARQ